jgi:hypothetical protein
MDDEDEDEDDVDDVDEDEEVDVLVIVRLLKRSSQFVIAGAQVVTHSEAVGRGNF